MKKCLRILLPLVAGLLLSVAGCAKKELPPDAVDTAADPSAMQDMPADPEAPAATPPADPAAPAAPQ